MHSRASAHTHTQTNVFLEISFYFLIWGLLYGGRSGRIQYITLGKKTVARWRLRRRFLTARDDVIRRKVIATRFLLHPSSLLSLPPTHMHILLALLLHPPCPAYVPPNCQNVCDLCCKGPSVSTVTLTPCCWHFEFVIWRNCFVLTRHATNPSLRLEVRGRGWRMNFQVVFFFLSLTNVHLHSLSCTRLSLSLTDTQTLGIKMCKKRNRTENSKKIVLVFIVWRSGIGNCEKVMLLLGMEGRERSSSPRENVSHHSKPARWKLVCR